MNITRQTTKPDAHCIDLVIHLPVAQGTGERQTPDPEAVIEEIQSRATWLGPVMEGILHESHFRT